MSVYFRNNVKYSNQNRLSGISRSGELGDFPRKYSIAGKIELDALKQMLDVEDAMTAPFDHFEAVLALRHQEVGEQTKLLFPR